MFKYFLSFMIVFLVTGCKYSEKGMTINQENSKTTYYIENKNVSFKIFTNLINQLKIDENSLESETTDKGFFGSYRAMHNADGSIYIYLVYSFKNGTEKRTLKKDE